jgi:hypothetical protein
MTSRFAPRTAQLLAPLALTAALALAFLAAGEAGTGAAATKKRVIGTAVSNGLRVQVTAIRAPRAGSAPDLATVRVAVFRRAGRSWDRLGRPLRVGQRSGWFWNVVTRPYGVRSLMLARPGGRYPSRVALRLLISPSIGPSATFRFVVDRDRLVAVDV